MALRVWLPLNGSLENIGISGNIYTTSLTSGNTGVSGGKIANQALQLTKSQQILPANNTSCMYGAKEISWAFWVKVNTAGDTQWLDGIRGITTNGSENATCRQEFYNNCASIGMWFGGGSISGKAFTPGIGTHLAGTLNYNTGETNFYINGVLSGTTTNATTTHYCRGDFYIGDSGVNILENDVRIYDHCLSALEIKELAQGLVLHYKLDNSTIESSQNLITTADCFENATCFNGATSKYGYGTTTDMYKTTGLFNGRGSTKVYMGTAGQNAYPYVYFNPFNAAGTVIQSLSFDYFPTSQTGLIPYSYNGAYNGTYVVNGVRGTANNAGTCPTLSVNLNQGNHIEITAIKTDTTNTTRGIGYIRIGTAAHTSTTTDYGLFTNVQIENKDHATQYMGIGGSRTGYAIDSSGYNNNGLIKNSPSIIAEDSPRYTASTKFNGTNDCIYLPEFYLGNEGSYGCGINTPTSTTRGGEAVILFNNTGSDADSQLAFGVHQQENRFESLANTKYTSTISYTNYYGNGHHFFATYNGNVLTTYMDGIVVNTKTITDARYNATHLTIGARCTNATATSFASGFEGQLSDVRVYVTTLSTEDILTLYHTSTQIDNLGGLHSLQMNEKQGNLLPSELLINNNLTSATGDNTNNQFVLVAPQGTTSRYGLKVGTNPRKIIPWGKTYRLCFDIYVPITTNFNIDYNNGSNDASVSLSGNDNDKISNRINTSFTVQANTGTPVALGSSNTDESKNPSHVALYDYSNFGIKTDSASSAITGYLRNPRWYLIDENTSTNFQILQNGVFNTNALKEDMVNSFTTYRNVEKETWAINFIEK